MTLLGIDGCPGGWFVAGLTEHGLFADFYEEVEQVFMNYKSPYLALIDMPLGLGNAHIARDIDRFARKELPGRHSCIFNPPVREALEAKSYEEAKSINIDISGKSLSIQSWNISKKIRELDRLLSRQPNLRKFIKEAHPEICFKYLNGGDVLATSKNAPKNEGIEHRLRILENYYTGISIYSQKVRKQFRYNTVRFDDIVDALCLAITASLGMQHGLNSITGSGKLDAEGIEIGIYYYNHD
jgi:8-oxo-dGTP diphosphatase